MNIPARQFKSGKLYRLKTNDEYACIKRFDVEGNTSISNILAMIQPGEIIVCIGEPAFQNLHKSIMPILYLDMVGYILDDYNQNWIVWEEV